MWRVHPARPNSFATPTTDPTSIVVILMNVEGTVAIRDIEPTIWGKGNVGGFERAFLAVEWAMPRHGHAPDFLATEGQLHNNVQVLAITEIDELLIPFDSQIDAMAATIEFFAKHLTRVPSGSKTKTVSRASPLVLPLWMMKTWPSWLTAMSCVVCQVNLSGNFGQSWIIS